MEMAPSMASPSPSPSSETASPSPASNPRQPNLRNPLPLSAAQEGQVKDLYYKRVRGHCAAEIKEFAACAVNRTVTATWICRTQRLAMNSCMVAHATRAEEDAAREEWFAGVHDRRRKREEEAAAVERRREEVVTLIRREEEKERLAKARELEEKERLEAQKKGGGVGGEGGGGGGGGRGWWR